MSLRGLNSRLNEIKIEVGTVKMDRNLTVIAMGSFIITSGLLIAALFIQYKADMNIYAGLSILFAGLFGLTCYFKQQKLNILKEEQQSLESLLSKYI